MVLGVSSSTWMRVVLLLLIVLVAISVSSLRCYVFGWRVIALFVSMPATIANLLLRESKTLMQRAMKAMRSRGGVIDGDTAP